MTITDTRKSRHLLLIVLWVALLILPGYKPTFAGSHASNSWQLVNPLPGIRTMNDIISVNGNKIAVGDSGSILTSNDGHQWQVQDSGVTYDLTGIAWNGSLYVVVGSNGIILTSNNATDWNTIIFKHPDLESNNEITRYRAVAWNGSLFLAVGDTGITARSFDGTNWTAGNNKTRKPMLDVIWANEQFISVGGGFNIFDILEGKIMTSSNGIDWQEQAVGNTYFRSILWGGGQYIIVGDSGNIYTSPNASINSWTPRPSSSTENLRDVIYNDSIYVVVGFKGAVLSSVSNPNISWNIETYLDSSSSNLRSITWDNINSEFIAVGSNKILSGTAPSLLADVSSGNTDTISGIAWGGSQYLAVTDTTNIYTSSDGFAWTGPGTANLGNFNDVFWDSSLTPPAFVAIRNGNQIVTSPDGLTWTAITTSNIANSLNGIGWNGISGAEAIYLVVGDNGIVQTSNDLATWITATNTGIGSTQLNAVTWDGTRFIVVANGGVIFSRSAEGSWKSLQSIITGQSNTLPDLYGITWNGLQYVAVGEENSLLLSEDALSWANPIPPPSPLAIDITDPTSTLPNLNSITWNDTENKFMIAGKNGALIISTGTDLTVAASANLSIATETDPLTYNIIVQNNGIFVATNINLTIDFQANVTWDGVGNNCTLALVATQITCQLGDLSPSTASSINISLSPDTPLIGSNMVTTVNASSDQNEPLPGDNSVTTTTAVQSLLEKFTKEALAANSGGGGGSLSYLWLLGLIFGLHRKISRYRP